MAAEAKGVGAPAEGSWRPGISHRISVVLLVPLALLLAGFVFYPLVRLAVISLTTGERLGNYVQVIQSSAGRRSLIVTFVASAIVTVISVVLGAVLAWYLVRTKHRWVRVVIWLAVLVPFWMGTVVKNYAIILLIARNGALNALLESVGLGPVRLLFTPTAVVLGMVYTMIPYAVFSLFGVFRTIDPSLLLAARSMGASRLRALGTIMIPLAMPGFVASSALVFAISLGFFVTPVLLGGAQVPFMATYVQDFVLRYFDLPIASAASVILLVCAFVVLGLALKAVGRERLMRALA